MTSRLSQIATRIRSDLDELENVLQRIREGWDRANRSGDMYYLDGVALNLHGLYSGLERLFELIAINIDGSKPTGENWHQELLNWMAMEIKAVRPAVISESSHNRLSEYRGFRHVVRNVYTVNFDPAKMRNLVEGAPGLFSQVRAELTAFAAFLDQSG
jgi:hypothetical protein